MIILPSEDGGEPRLTFQRLLNLPMQRVLSLCHVLQKERERERVVIRELGDLGILSAEEMFGGREKVGEGLGEVPRKVG